MHMRPATISRELRMIRQFFRLLLPMAVLLQATPGWAADVVVGQVTPLSGPEARQGVAYAAGLKLALDDANRGTGNPMRHNFKLVSLDDRADPEQTVQQTRKLIAESQPQVLAGYVGGPSLAKLLESGVLEKNQLSMVGYRSAQILPKNQPLFAIKAGMAEELNKLMTHLSTVGWTRVVLLYENEAGADDLLAAADAAAQQAKVTLLDRIEIGKSGLGSKVERVIRVKPQAVVMVASGFVAGAFIERFRLDGALTPLFTQSNADTEQLAMRLNEDHLRGLVIAQVMPNPYKVTTAISKAFNDLARNAKPPVARSFTTMEGYVAGRVIVEAAQRQRGKPTREGMAAALESINNLDLGGYAIAFSPSSHRGSSYVDLSIVGATGKVQQ